MSRSTAHPLPDQRASSAEYVLHLFVSGTTALSTRAIVNVRKLCETHLEGRYELKVVDVAQNPEHAAEEQLIALPTLVKKFPVPLKRFVGDLSNAERFLAAFDLRPHTSDNRD